VNRPQHVTRIAAVSLLAAAALSLPVGPVLAHGPDPIIGTATWARDQVVPYQWSPTGVPPSWMAAAIDAGAGDVGESRASRAAVFARSASAPAQIAYGGYVPCDSYGIACMDRSGMYSGIFGVWFRPQGWAFDWGYLRWCQGLSIATNGCYDAENVALDELGHVEILGHHVNYADGSDFTDAVVQYAARQRPYTGWNQHAFGRCDVARLQLEYERRDPANPVSTCLSLATTNSLSPSATSIWIGGTIWLNAFLRITSTAAAGAMAGDPLSDRTVVLQRRAVGATAWTTVGTMPPNPSTEGNYRLSWSPTTTYDWRTIFSAPTGDGVQSSTSAVVRVTVSGCTGSGCPQSAPGPASR
jgi:hypothetical protein